MFANIQVTYVTVTQLAVKACARRMKACAQRRLRWGDVEGTGQNIFRCIFGAPHSGWGL